MLSGYGTAVSSAARLVLSTCPVVAPASVASRPITEPGRRAQPATASPSTWKVVTPAVGAPNRARPCARHVAHCPAAITPPALYASLNARFSFNFDPCPFPKPDDFDGLTSEWGDSSYVNIPFGSIMHQGPGDKKPKKKGPTAWVRKAIAEHQKGKRVVLVFPVDKWLLMLLAAGAKVENLGDVRWLATEDGSIGKGTGRHIACFILDPAPPVQP